MMSDNHGPFENNTRDMHLVPLAQSLITVLLVLAVATVVSIILSKKKPKSETFKKVRVIVKSWWLILAPFISALYLGSPYLIVLFFGISCFGVWELINYSKFRTMRIPFFVVTVLVTLVHYFLLYFKLNYLFLIFIPFCFIWIVPIVVIIFSAKNSLKDLPTLAALILGTLLITYYLSFVPAIAHLDLEIWSDPNQSLMAVMVLSLLTEVNDIFQFISGKAFGKYKIIPSISPNKTEAGFIGGLLLTTGLSTFVCSAALDFSLTQAALIGAVISITGMLGDLLFSAIKRHFEVKDFSDLIPGHGGLLDRLDSLILTAPAFYLILFLLKRGFS